MKLHRPDKLSKSKEMSRPSEVRCNCFFPLPLRDIDCIVTSKEKTINILMGRTKQEAKRKEMLDDSPDKATIAKLGVDESSLSSATCYICSGLRDCLSCSFCGKESCLNCARRCDACGEIFCGFCSLLKYAIYLLLWQAYSPFLFSQLR